MHSDLISIEDAAAEFNVHRTTLFRHITEGRLAKHTRVGDRRTFLDRLQVQQLVEDPSVARCLQLVYDRFKATAEWPVATDIQRELDRESGQDFDFLAAIESLPRDLGWRVRDMEGHAQLTIRGIARCEGSSDDVAAFVALVRACHERYVSDEPMTVSRAQLAEAYGFDAATLGRIYLITQVEAGFWAGLGNTADGEWTVTVDSERIRNFRDVHSLSDYFNAKQKAFQPRQGPMLGFSPGFAVGVGRGTSLHPAIAEAVGDLQDTPAVIAAASALERLIVERTGDVTRHGAGLIGRYFDTALRISGADARRLEALRALATAAYGAYRNVAAHGRLEFVGAQAQEIVTLFSLLAREIEATPMPIVEQQVSKLVKKELAELPKGAHADAMSMYRMVYAMVRQKGLGANPEGIPPTREYAAEQALAEARRVNPTFEVPSPQPGSR